MSGPAKERRLHVLFSGSVQGVGFRYTAVTRAETFPITGWVRNLSDGRVELVAEGKQADLEEYLEEIKSEMGGYVNNVELNWEAATGEYGGFHVAPTE
jgi:acylphosphatase